MDVNKTIKEIELLERIYALPDSRQLRLADREAANQKHDEMYADNPCSGCGSDTASEDSGHRETGGRVLFSMFGRRPATRSRFISS